MKSKFKKTIAFVTAFALIAISIPHIMASDVDEQDITIQSIAATYEGEELLVGTTADVNDITITATYSDESCEVLNKEDCIINNEEQLIVSDETNSYPILYKNDQNIKTDVVVKGYTKSLNVENIKSEYYVGETISKNDLNVYMSYSNSKTTSVIKSDNYTIKNNDKIVEGKNEYKVVYKENDKEYTTTFTVTGYKPIIKATYDEKVEVGESLNLNDVEIIITYGSNEINYSGSNNEIKFLTSTEIKSTGKNNIKISTPYGETTLVVRGYSDDNDDTDSGVKLFGEIKPIKSISATYTGNDVLVNGFVNADDVNVTVTYTDNTTFDAGSDCYLKNTSGTPKVLTTGYNDFTVYYTDEDENEYTTTLQVWGYDYKEIKATYNGKDVEVGNKYDINDVSVDGYYTERKDGESENFEITDFDINKDTVSAKGVNEYEVTANFTIGSTQKTEKTTFTITGFVRIVINNLTATYTGNDVLVGNTFNADNIKVTAIYSDNSQKEIVSSDFEITPFKDGVGPVVADTGWNTFTVTVEGTETEVNVWGYTPEKIDATYTGDDILITDIATPFYSKDVSVSLIYTPYHNGDVKTEKIDAENYTLVNDKNEANPTVYNVGNNVYTITYEEFKDTINVWGYTFASLSATYKGQDIEIEKQYNKADVEVTATYTMLHDGSIPKNKVTDFEVNSLDVTTVGANNYTATCNLGTAGFTVNGVAKPVILQSITAQYNGPDVLVGNTFSADNVEVIASYSDGSQKTASDFEITPFKDGVGPIISDVEWNTFTVTFEGKEAEIKVWGYKPEKIEATYTGDDILVSNPFYSHDVEVKLIYTKHSDDSIDEEIIEQDNYTITNSESKPSPVVSDVKWNTFTVTYDEFNDTIEVWGYKLDKLEAVYNGPEILVGTNYDIKDVTVKATFTPYHDDSVLVENITEFTTDSLLVEKENKNTYTASCNYGDADFDVNGYLAQENEFAIEVVDINNNPINDYEVSYTINDLTGKITSNQTIKIGENIVTTDNYNVTIPKKYKVVSNDLKTEAIVGLHNDYSKYTLKIVINQLNKNTVSFIAYDTNNNVINDIELYYTSNNIDYKLVSGSTDKIMLDYNEIANEAACRIVVPNGYKLVTTTINENANDTNVDYTVVATLEKVEVVTEPNETDEEVPDEINEETPTENKIDKPEKETVTPSETVPEEQKTSINTGDNSNIMIYIIFAGLALCIIITTILLSRKSKK